MRFRGGLEDMGGFADAPTRREHVDELGGELGVVLQAAFFDQGVDFPTQFQAVLLLAFSEQMGKDLEGNGGSGLDEGVDIPDCLSETAMAAQSVQVGEGAMVVHRHLPTWQYVPMLVSAGISANHHSKSIRTKRTPSDHV
jgi:hypothetical protein